MQSSILLNNLGVLHMMLSNFDAAEKLFLQSVATSESEVFSLIRSVHAKYLRNDAVFLAKLPVLVYGYIYCHAARRGRLNYKRSP